MSKKTKMYNNTYEILIYFKKVLKTMKNPIFIKKIHVLTNPQMKKILKNVLYRWKKFIRTNEYGTEGGIECQNGTYGNNGIYGKNLHLQISIWV